MESQIKKKRWSGDAVLYATLLTAAAVSPFIPSVTSNDYHNDRTTPASVKNTSSYSSPSIPPFPMRESSLSSGERGNIFIRDLIPKFRLRRNTQEYDLIYSVCAEGHKDIAEGKISQEKIETAYAMCGWRTVMYTPQQ